MLPPRLFRLPAGSRSKYAILLVWLVLGGLAGPLAVQLTGVLDNDQLGALPVTAEAQRAQDRIGKAFPGSDALIAVAVYARDGRLTDGDLAKIDADRKVFARFAVDGVAPEIVPGADGKAALMSFALAGTDEEQSAATERVKDQLATAAPTGLRTALTGSAGGNSDVFDAFEGMDTTLLLVTVLAVALLLIVTYRSPMLWLIPLLVVGIAGQVAGAVVYLLAKHAGLTVDFQSQNILTVLVFGVGVDYALLLIARYRQELNRQPDRHRAMATALHRSFPAIAASAGTVAVALLCLLAADLPSTRGLGPVAAIGVGATFLAMSTLLPAIMVIGGRWLFWPFVPRAGAPVPPSPVWSRIAGGVERRPVPVWAGAAAVLIALSLGVGTLSVGMPGDEYFTEDVGSVTGQHLLDEHFPGGRSAPAQVVVAAERAEATIAVASRVSGVADVSTVGRSPDGRWALLDVILSDPPETEAAMATVDRLRLVVHRDRSADALVGGVTAVTLDTERVAERDNRIVFPLILVVVLLVLIWLLKALVAPMILLVSVVVSYVAALGGAGLILTAIGHPRLWVGIPLQTFLFLVALGVDYTIFLMTRAREEAAVLGHGAGIRQAMAVTGGVITSAGVVLAATFAALGVLPLVPSLQTGIIVSFGVILDAIIVRTMLVPALAHSVGRRTWWPGKLSRSGS